jgi:hypothetical protein
MSGSKPILWQIDVSHYSEKARWALDYKGVDAARGSPLPGVHMAIALCLTRGARKTSTAPPARAAWTAQSPTGPRPRTATVSPERIPAWEMAWKPVPITSPAKRATSEEKRACAATVSSPRDRQPVRR